jgi:hypothetical protein
MNLCLLLFVLLQASAFVIPNPRHHDVKCSQTLINLSTRVGDAVDASSSVSSRTSNAPDESNLLPQYSGLHKSSQANPLKSFLDGYSRLTKEHYLLMALLQAGFLASVADVTTQSLESATLDVGHVAAMATVASIMSGAMNAIWLRQLEQAFPGTETKEVAAKTLIHAILIASIINSAYLVGVPLLSEYFYGSGGFSLPPMDLSVLRGGWKLDEFITLTKLEILMFIPYNTLAFKFVPPSIRPLTHAAISATFNIAVSAVTLGYFNVWCERAMSTFS